MNPAPITISGGPTIDSSFTHLNFKPSTRTERHQNYALAENCQALLDWLVGLAGWID